MSLQRLWASLNVLQPPPPLKMIQPSTLSRTLRIRMDRLFPILNLRLWKVLILPRMKMEMREWTRTLTNTWNFLRTRKERPTTDSRISRMVWTSRDSRQFSHVQPDRRTAVEEFRQLEKWEYHCREQLQGEVLLPDCLDENMKYPISFACSLLDEVRISRHAGSEL